MCLPTPANKQRPVLQDMHPQHTAVERIWHIEYSPGQIFALAFRQTSLNPFKLSSPRSEAATVSPHIEATRQTSAHRQHRDPLHPCRGLRTTVHWVVSNSLFECWYKNIRLSDILKGFSVEISFEAPATLRAAASPIGNKCTSSGNKGANLAFPGPRVDIWCKS